MGDPGAGLVGKPADDMLERLERDLDDAISASHAWPLYQPHRRQSKRSSLFPGGRFQATPRVPQIRLPKTAGLGAAGRQGLGLARTSADERVCVEPERRGLLFGQPCLEEERLYLSHRRRLVDQALDRLAKLGQTEFVGLH